jgi:hypothetical protein
LELRFVPLGFYLSLKVTLGVVRSTSGVSAFRLTEAERVGTKGVSQIQSDEKDYTAGVAICIGGMLLLGFAAPN